jgi:hypothetical protein
VAGGLYGVVPEDVAKKTGLPAGPYYIPPFEIFEAIGSQQ